MAVIAGADGCPAGWIAVLRDDATGAIGHALARDAAELLERAAHADLLVIDIPIGLSDAAPRACDLAARALLGPRRSSVFPAPLRTALDAPDHASAHARTRAARAAAGLPATGISIQAWGIFAKVRDVDAVMSPDVQRRVREGHPELAFRRLAGRDLEPKRTPEGYAARRAIVAARFGADAVAAARTAYRVGDVAHDDLLDAFGCLDIAGRALRGEAIVLPDADPPRDARGLRMEILH